MAANAHSITLANGTLATRNSKTRVYTHATVRTMPCGKQSVVSWHGSRELAERNLNRNDANRRMWLAKGATFAVHPVGADLRPAAEEPAAEETEPASTLTAREAFRMSRKALMAAGCEVARAELTRRGRCPDTGRKVA